MTRKLDIGHAVPGYDGYETCDIRPGADHICSATNVSSLGKFDELLCNMVLEHLRPWEIGLALFDWREALVVGGYVDVVVPDLIHIIDLITNGNLEEGLRRLFGGSLYPGGPDDCLEQEHRWAFTESSLSHELFEAGYSDAKRMPSTPGILWMRAWK